MTEKLSDRGNAKSIVGLITVVLAAIALAGYVFFVTKGGNRNYLQVLLPLVIVLFARLSSFFVKSDLILLAGNVGISIALCAFIKDSVQILIGYFTKVAIFGDVTQFGMVAFLTVVMALCTIFSIIYSFFK